MIEAYMTLEMTEAPNPPKFPITSAAPLPTVETRLATTPPVCPFASFPEAGNYQVNTLLSSGTLLYGFVMLVCLSVCLSVRPSSR
jgi:hypothetical protein